MNKELLVLGATMSVLLFAITTSSVTTQNITTNATNAVEMRVHQLIKLLQKLDRICLPLSVMLVNANQTISELGTNASNAMNNTGEAVNATANELGKNASDMGYPF